MNHEEKSPRQEILRDVQAIIFDMDGTMINNMPYHAMAWKKFCKQHGLDLTDEEFKQKISGKKNNEIFQIIFKRELTSEEAEKFAEEKESIYREIYKDHIHEIPGLKSLVKKIRGMNIPVAIATTAPQKNREFALEMLGIPFSDFAIIVGDEEVSKGKPDPEIYLKTAQGLGIEPSKCLVFEDSPAGVESAKNAGMKVVAITSSHSHEELAGADFFEKDFKKLA